MTSDRPTNYCEGRTQLNPQSTQPADGRAELSDSEEEEIDEVVRIEMGDQEDNEEDNEEEENGEGNQEGLPPPPDFIPFSGPYPPDGNHLATVPWCSPSQEIHARAHGIEAEDLLPES